VSESFSLDPVERIAAGAVGEPGDRTFYLQARSDDQFVTLLVEKEQMRALALSIAQMLQQLPEPSGSKPDVEAEPDLDQPLLPEWRVGPMALHYDESRDRIVLIASEQPPPEGEDEPPPAEAPDLATARFVATRAQMRALAEHAQRVVEAGRPRCRFCGSPMNADGHVCTAMNGHRES